MIFTSAPSGFVLRLGTPLFLDRDTVVIFYCLFYIFQMPNQEQMQGPVWLFFLKKETEPFEMFKHVNITFDIDLITAKDSDDVVYLEESYKVSFKHEVRTQLFGNWTVKEGLKAPDHQSPYHRRFDLEGIELRAGYFEVESVFWFSGIACVCSICFRSKYLIQNA